MNVLFLTQSTALGPSSRYRVYQLLLALEKLGIHSHVSPAIEDELYSEIYLEGRGSRRTALAATWRKRRADLHRLEDFDAVIVQKGVFPGLYSGFEREIARQKPLIFDFDDAIWLPRQGGSLLLRALHREQSVQAVLGCARAVIAGNQYLAAYAQRFNANVTVVPSAVDTTRYPRRYDGTIVGWIGSRTTLPYLKPLAPVFQRLGIKPRVIAAGNPDFPCEFRLWHPETEVEELSQLGVGIAPLPDTPWERGKCGVKLLQYMACDIPVIASPVGVHREIIHHGENGLLAKTPQEWRESLDALLHQPALREKLGQAGRRTVAERFDITVAAQKVAMVLKAAAGRS